MSEVLPWSAPTLEGRIESEGRSGEALLSRARIEANRLRRSILSAATLEAEKLRSNAEEEGFLSGYASGRDQAALEMKKELQLLQSAAGEEIASFQREYEERWAAAMGSLSEQLVELALAACRKLVGQVPREQLPMEQIRRAIEVVDDGGMGGYQSDCSYPTDDGGGCFSSDGIDEFEDPRNGVGEWKVLM